MNINIINNPWAQLEKISSSLENQENIDPNAPLSLAGEFEKQENVDIEVLKHWELQYYDFRLRYNDDQKKTPQQESDYKALQKLHAKIGDVALKTIKKTKLKVYETTNEKDLEKILATTKNELETYPFRRLVIYDQNAHSFYVYKYDHSKLPNNQEMGIRYKKIHKYEACELIYDVFHAYIGFQDDNKQIQIT
jgi:hypothetical protein